MALKNVFRSKRVISIALAGVLVAGVAGCSTDSSSSSSGTILNVGGQADNLTRVFNPYLPDTAYSLGSKGMIYENLVQINYVKVGSDIPWLAKTWEWAADNKSVTFHLESGVKWADGKPFTAKDVVFSYELMKKFPALNTLGVDFDTIKASDDNTVVITFAQPSEQDFTTLVQLPIVSEHLWSKVKDPTTFQDSKPVGTGPFELSTFSPQSYLLTKNKDYWQPGKPAIDGLRFISYKDNQAQANALVQGQIDWAGTYIANAKETYLSKNKDFNYWAPDVGQDGLIPNNEVFPFKGDPAVKQAISLAVDRTQIADSRNSHPATSQIGLPMPAFQDAIASEYKGLDFKQDKAGAAKILEDDGWVKDSSGYYAKGGKELAFSISFPSAYTDIAAPAQVIVSQLKDAGMKVSIDGVAVTDINKMTASGKFETTIGYPVDSAPTVYSFYNNIMNPAYYKPIGTDTPTFQNIQRYQDPEAAKLLADYPNAATDADRKAIIAKLEGIWIKTLPMVTLFYWGYYGDWSTAKATGFPDESDPYFAPNPNVVVATRIKPAGK
jgi:peptide/nickel transport system substrate-binding protein